MKPSTVAVGFLDPGHWSHCFGQSLIDTYLTDAFSARRMVPEGRQLRVNCQAGGLVAGRNEVARQFLDLTECEWLFVVDSDMGFGPDTVHQLIGSANPSTRPVVGGLCFSLRKDTPGEFYGQKYVVVPTCYELAQDGDALGFRSIINYERDSVIKVDGTGSACIVIHRSALEKIRAEHGDHWYDPITLPDGTTFSEDLSFCLRLQSVGLEVFVNTNVRTTHDKHGVFLDEDEFDRCLALHASRAEAA